MIDYVEVELGGSRASARLADVTFIVGTGKSAFLEVLYAVLSSVGRRLPRLRGRWGFRVQADNVSYSVSAVRSRVRQVVRVGSDEAVFEYLPPRPAHRLVKPIEMAIDAADVVIPEVRTKEHVAAIAEEDIERLNSMLALARRKLGVKTLMLGPYVAPRSLAEAGKPADRLDRHARNLPAVLAYLSLNRPPAYDEIRARLRKLGIVLSVGLTRFGSVGVALYIRGAKIPLFKAPCSAKSLLAIAAALQLKPDLLIVDNFDYCMTRGTAGVLSELLRQRPATKLVAEIHSEEVAEWFDVQNKSVVEVRL
jgi:hypothetical protein